MPQFLIPALISGGAGLIGSGMQASAASSAAKTQADAANRASQNQMDMFQQIQRNLAPYMGVGTNGIGAFNNQMFGGGALGQAPNMTTGSGDVWSGAPTTGSGDIFNGSPSLITGGALPSVYQPWGTGADAQATLEQTPGYQFTLNQGLKSLGNSFASRGLGASGAALKGASQYTTGLADNTYNQQLQNNMAQQGQQYGQGLSNQTTAFNQGLQGYGQYFSQLLGANQQKLAGQNQLFGQGLAGNAQALAGQQQLFGQGVTSGDTLYNRLMGALGIGQSAANGTGTFGTQATSASNGYLTGGASALAGGQVGGANAIAGGLGNVGSSISQAYLLNRLFPAANNNGPAGGMNAQVPNYPAITVGGL
jgi:hypothetical protein